MVSICRLEFPSTRICSVNLPAKTCLNSQDFCGFTLKKKASRNSSCGFSLKTAQKSSQICCSDFKSQVSFNCQGQGYPPSVLRHQSSSRGLILSPRSSLSSVAVSSAPSLMNFLPFLLGFLSFFFVYGVCKALSLDAEVEKAILFFIAPIPFGLAYLVNLAAGKLKEIRAARLNDKGNKE